MDLDHIIFGDDGLVPCVVQDARGGEVLMLAYANREALELTQETGQMHFYSRSRQRIWRKGETSGNTLALRSLRYDCDGDALLALVEPAGPACHTGENSCFYRDLGGHAATYPDAPRADGEPDPGPFEALPRLARVIAARASGAPEGSYTAKLLADGPLAGEKVSEEAEEVVRAAAGESDQRLAEEAADLLYHLAVLLARRGVGLEAAGSVLNARRAQAP
jgi:phosphoribosyl-ATP pyrophosphohydrolase/phosphoribosyl-AMP cyclohydrolase